MKEASLAFLREIGTPPEAIDILRDEARGATITGDVLASYLRAAFDAGRRAARDPYVWHSAAELIDRHNA